MKKAFSVATVFLSLTLLLSLFIVYGCGGGGGGGGVTQGPTILTGALIDSPVAGVEYETNTQSGITDSQGTFKYQSGETVSFYIGGVFLGSSQGQAVITPVDLVDGATDIFHPAVTNIARLLQSLDEDENPDNGIYISESTANLLQQKDIDITDPNLDFDNNIEIHSLLSEIGNILVTANEAQLHLLKELGDNDTGLAQELANAGPWYLKSIDNVDAYAIGGTLTMTSSTFTYTNNMTCTESGSYFINDGKYIATITSLSGNCGDDFVGEVTYSDYFFDTDTFGLYIEGELWLFENFEDEIDIDDDFDGYTENEGDCNDNNPLINPNAEEICGDGIDQDCNGSDLNCINDGSIIGTWCATRIDGSIDPAGAPLVVTCDVSTFIFHSNGDYSWFLHALPYYNWDDSGTYSYENQIITFNGLASQAPADGYIEFTEGSNSFTFLDEDGDRWIYERSE